MDLQSYLVFLRLNIVASVVYDFLKNYLRKTINPKRKEVKDALQDFLSIENAEIYSDKIIDFLAVKGDIVVDGSQIFSKERLFFKSASATSFQIKNDSTSETEHNSIKVGAKALIKGSGGASIVQNDKGIAFSA